MASPTLQTLNIANASITFDNLVNLTNNLASLANKGVYIDGTPTNSGANVVIIGSEFVTDINANTGNIVSFSSNTITANTATLTNAKLAAANIVTLVITGNTNLGSASTVKLSGSVGNTFYVVANTTDNTLYFKELKTSELTDWANVTNTFSQNTYVNNTFAQNVYVTNTFSQNTYVNNTFAQNTFLNSEITRIENEALAFAIALG